MKKKTILPILLAALPVAAMMAAFMPGAVKYVYPDGEVVTATYMDAMQEVNTAVCMPAAVIAVGICIFFAAAYIFSGKASWLKAISGAAFAAALLAVMPYLIQDEIKALPSVIVPIAMMLEWLTASRMGKTAKSQPAAEEKGSRLDKR